MPWMRVAIGVGAGALMTGVAGILVSFDGSHFLDVAVGLSMAGLLTLVACVLTKVFGSSHGSQDDAFNRGRDMGYDAGFLEGHRVARPVLVPLHGFGRDADDRTDRGVDADIAHDVENDPVIPPRLIAPAGELRTLPRAVPSHTGPPRAIPAWGREAMPAPRRSFRARMVGWVVVSRKPLLAGALSLALVGVIVANAMASPSVAAVASPMAIRAQIDQALQPGTVPALVNKTDRPAWSVAVEARLALGGSGIYVETPTQPGVNGVPGVAGAPGAAGVTPGVPANGAAGALPVLAASGLPGVGLQIPSAIYTPPASAPITSPSTPSSPSAPAVVPVVAAPAVPLTAAEQTAATALAAANLTAANALAASNLTAANAKKAADLTAANAAAAAAETARVAAAAAEATRIQAIADAYAVAHPAG